MPTMRLRRSRRRQLAAVARPGRSASTAALAAALLAAMLILVPRPSADQPSPDDPGPLTITVVEARRLLDDFVVSLNDGDVEAAFALLADSVRSNPGAINGPGSFLPLDFSQEYEHAVWTAALGGKRTVGACSVGRWTHLVGGEPVTEDAQLLVCAGTLTNDFYSTLGMDPAPTELTVAVGPGHELLLYHEWVVDESHTRVLLAFRRWLRAHRPELVGAMFSDGGTPVASPRSARLMLDLASAFAAWDDVNPAVFEAMRRAE